MKIIKDVDEQFQVCVIRDNGEDYSLTFDAITKMLKNDEIIKGARLIDDTLKCYPFYSTNRSKFALANGIVFDTDKDGLCSSITFEKSLDEEELTIRLSDFMSGVDKHFSINNNGISFEYTVLDIVFDDELGVKNSAIMLVHFTEFVNASNNLTVNLIFNDLTFNKSKNSWFYAFLPEDSETFLWQQSLESVISSYNSSWNGEDERSIQIFGEDIEFSNLSAELVSQLMTVSMQTETLTDCELPLEAVVKGFSFDDVDGSEDYFEVLDYLDEEFISSDLRENGNVKITDYVKVLREKSRYWTVDTIRQVIIEQFMSVSSSRNTMYFRRSFFNAIHDIFDSCGQGGVDAVIAYFLLGGKSQYILDKFVSIIQGI